jgi:seryl-tRNA synthetase
MLDINYIREHQVELKQAIANKQLNPSVVDEVVELDDQRRKLIIQVEKIRQEVNQNTNEIKSSPTKKPTPDQITKGRELKSQLQDVEPELKKVE